MILGQTSLPPPLLSLTNQWYCSMCKAVFWDEVLAAHRYPTSRTVAGFRSSHRHARRGAVRPHICLAGSCSGHSLSFFFQAEDGIRDYKVTGVQTCALPI